MAQDYFAFRDSTAEFGWLQYFGDNERNQANIGHEPNGNQ